MYGTTGRCATRGQQNAANRRTGGGVWRLGRVSPGRLASPEPSLCAVAHRHRAAPRENGTSTRDSTQGTEQARAPIMRAPYAVLGGGASTNGTTSDAHRRGSPSGFRDTLAQCRHPPQRSGPSPSSSTSSSTDQVAGGRSAWIWNSVRCGHPVNSPRDALHATRMTVAENGGGSIALPPPSWQAVAVALASRVRPDQWPDEALVRVRSAEARYGTRHSSTSRTKPSSVSAHLAAPNFFT